MATVTATYELDLYNPFERKLSEIAATHRLKSQDYGTKEDPYANVRATTEFGIPAWVGAVIRAGDKFFRIKSFIKNGTLKNEPIKDSFLDISVYMIIADILYDQEHLSQSPHPIATRETPVCSQCYDYIVDCTCSQGALQVV